VRIFLAQFLWTHHDRERYGKGSLRVEGGYMVRDYIMIAVFLLAASFVVHRLLKRHWNAKR